MITAADAKQLISLARDSILASFNHTKVSVNSQIKLKFSKKLGVFVTLHLHGGLRGCIGFPEPVLPLYEAVIEAASEAAFGDPRFMPLSRKEYGQIAVEMSVLTTPELIKVNNPEEYPSCICIGKDGLIIRSTYGQGLLLPQVAPEWGWNPVEFLANTCIKAGLSPDFWKDNQCRIYKFQAQIFREENNKVIEVSE
jgi:uncharacterized protein